MPADSCNVDRPATASSRASFVVRSLAHVALQNPNGLAGLADLFDRTHGPRARAEGWLAVKLRRECVDLEASCIAMPDDGALHDATRWLGFALVGTPPSLAPHARMSGMGVVPGARGRGLARRMLAFTHAHLPDATIGLRCLAEPATRPMYAHLGFRVAHGIATLHHTGSGTRTELSIEPGRWGPRGRVLCRWLDESWARSPREAQRSWQCADACARLTWEGPALLVHHLEVRASVTPRDELHILSTLRASISSSTPLLMYGWPDDPDALDAVMREGWRVAQRAQVMIRER